ncbi:CHAT domain-containing protein [Jatrophihabitans sp.]|uniref:CHAT domain-containing protein n=1 Tax=Jatrophihabitans sp. TaxID=1932789 RepID=UPI002C6BB5DD|nr:CHAT domain-containing protein [Jatrophihabitans sp.]
MSRIGSGELAEAGRLHALGVEHNNAGHPLRAVRLFRRALSLPELARPADEQARLVAARIWISLAMSESEVIGADCGLADLAEAERLVELTGNPGLRALLHLQYGYIQVRAGHFAAGLAHLDAAVELIEYAEPAHACNILINRGSLQLYRGQLGAARQDLIRSADLAAEHGLRVEEFKARHNLGYLEFLAGNLALALKIMDDVQAIDAQVSLAVALLDRARVLLEAGLHRESDDSLIEAAALFRADRLHKELAEVELARAECALLDGEIAAARRLAATARDRFRRRANDRWRRDAELVLLHADLAAGRPGGRLAGPALRLAAEFRAAGLDTQARTSQLIAAEALLRAGRTEQAREVAGEAGPVRPADPVSARLHTRLVRARLSIAAGDAGTARREARTGLAELARHQAQFGSIDLQTASAVHGRQLAELDLSMALADGKPAGVLAAIERGRATSSRLPRISAPSDPVVAELLAELRRTVEALRSIRSDAAAAEQAGAQRRRVADLQRRLRARAWQAAGVGSAPRPASLGQIEAELGRTETALACYFDVGGRLHAVLLAGGRSEIVPLGSSAAVSETVRRVRADLDVLAHRRLPAALLTSVCATLNRSLATLAGQLLDPLRLPEDRLVIVPTGMLAALPWTNLPPLRGRPVVVAPSATAWLAAATRAPGRGGGPVVALAGPDLTHAPDEVRAVGAVWPGARVLTGEQGGREALVSALSAATVVHVAAHGQHHAENPLFSLIRLVDGPLFAYELDHTSRAAEHVVLSACELGQATIRAGDEALGLTSVLLRLGSRSVISGVARVPDDVAAEVMTRYHAALAGGLDSAAALADACAGSGTPAPFVCFGATW